MTTTTAFDLGALTAGFKQAMQALYGDGLAKVILYGSYIEYVSQFLLYTQAYLRQQNLL